MSKDELDKIIEQMLKSVNPENSPFVSPTGVPLFVKQLSEEDAELLLMATTAEVKKGDLDIPLAEMGWQIEAVEQRIRVMKLPIKFTNLAYVSFGSFTKTVGGCMVILIDALNRYENKTVNVEMLCHMYPFGFYSDKSLHDYIDNNLKTRAVKWSEVYMSTT
jgi:hypothetical protein